MGKNKKGPKPNVFKVAGAKSLKKSKAKVVNLGLKNIKQKVQDIDKEFLDIKKTKKIPTNFKPEQKALQKKVEKKVTKEEVAATTNQINKMDL